MKLILLVLIAMVGLVVVAKGQEHRHPIADAPIHEQFYSNWMRPDNPNVSCCNKEDCRPTVIHWMAGHPYGERKDGTWIRIPEAKIELNRDSPDGRSHICSVGDTVFCFIYGTAG